MCSSCHNGVAFTDELPHQSFKPATAIKTPSLLNIALSAPYMHDGSLETLADVVDHYASVDGFDGSGAPDAREAALLRDETELRPIDLTADERQDLIAFCAR